jgi:uncharacterized protein
MVVTTAPVRSVNPMSLRTLRTFIIATFVLSWGAGVLLTVFPDQAEALFGPMGYTNPAFILIVIPRGLSPSCWSSGTTGSAAWDGSCDA